MNNLLKSPDSEEGKFMQYSCFLQLDISLVFWCFTSMTTSIFQYLFIVIDGLFVWTCIKESLTYSNKYDINQQRFVLVGVLTSIAYLLSMGVIQTYPIIALIILIVLFTVGLSNLANIIVHSKNNSKDNKFINSYFKTLRIYAHHKQKKGNH